MAVLGVINSLSPNFAVTVFGGTILFIIFLQSFIEWLCVWAERNRYGELMDKLHKELLNMGLISFAIFVFDSFAPESETLANSKEAFEFVHIVLLFIAVGFIIQACYLIKV